MMEGELFLISAILVNILIVSGVIYALLKLTRKYRYRYAKQTTYIAFSVYLLVLLLAVPTAFLTGDATGHSEFSLELSSERSGVDWTDQVMDRIENRDEAGLQASFRTTSNTFSPGDFVNTVRIRDNIDSYSSYSVIQDIDPRMEGDITVTLVYPHSEINDWVVTDYIPDGQIELVANELILAFEDTELKLSEVTPMFSVSQFVEVNPLTGNAFSGGFSSMTSRAVLWIQTPERLSLRGENLEQTRIERQDEE